MDGETEAQRCWEVYSNNPSRNLDCPLAWKRQHEASQSKVWDGHRMSTNSVKEFVVLEKLVSECLSSAVHLGPIMWSSNKLRMDSLRESSRSHFVLLILGR